MACVHALEKEMVFFHGKTFSAVIRTYHSVVSDSATPWTIAYQAPPSLGFSRQVDWSGLPFPSPEKEMWGRTASDRTEVTQQQQQQCQS